MTNRLRSSLLASSFIAASMGVAAPAAAADNADDGALVTGAILTAGSVQEESTEEAADDRADAQSGRVAEIIVTAKSRAERLQDVPLAISAFSAEDLREAQVTGLEDLQDVTPNLYLSISSRNDPTAYGMRGLTPNTSDERYQGVSFFLDGIPLSGQLASLDLNSVERVEVIKGPQSATFGRATYSGAINFITAEPSSDRVTGQVRGRGGLVLGGPDVSYLVSASIEAPIVQDRLWLSVGGTMYQNGAVASAVDDGDPVGRERSQIATATLFFRPSDTLSINLRGIYSHDRDFAPLAVIQHPRDWVLAGVDLVPLPRAGGAFYPAILPDPDVGLIANLGAEGTRRDRYFGSLIVSKEFGDYELTYRGGYFYNDDHRDRASSGRAILPGQDPVFGDLIGTGAVTLTNFAGVTSISREIFENTSHQLVLLSPSDSRFRWRAGGYYFWEADETMFPPQGTVANPTGRARLEKLENYAAFGGIDFDITEQLTISGEGRIAREKLVYTACPTCTSPIAVEGTHTSTDFTPRVTLSYQLTPDNLLYALYSKGVKSARQSRVVVAGTPTIVVAEPEELSNFEIGSKNSFFDRRVTLNLAGFYQKVKNQQLVSSTNFVVNGQIVPVTFANNVGESEIWGFEAETVAAITDAFTLRGSLGYAHHEFVNGDPIIISASSAYGFPGALGDPVVLTGLTQTNVPRWNGAVSGQYVVPEAFGDMDLSIRLDGNYRGKFYADLPNMVTVRSAWTFNSRISFSNEKVDLALFGRNIFNNRRAVGSGLAGGSSSCAFRESDTAFYGTSQQCLQATAQRPSEFGIEAVFRF